MCQPLLLWSPNWTQTGVEEKRKCGGEVSGGLRIGVTSVPFCSFFLILGMGGGGQPHPNLLPEVTTSWHEPNYPSVLQPTQCSSPPLFPPAHFLGAGPIPLPGTCSVLFFLFEWECRLVRTVAGTTSGKEEAAFVPWAMFSGQPCLECMS